MTSRYILLTPGEPAGIGPDLILQLAEKSFKKPIIVVASKRLLQQRAKQLGLSITINDASLQNVPKHIPNMLHVLDIPLVEPCIPGKLNISNAAYVLETIKTAASTCLNNPSFSLVTGPIHKGIINESGISFTGHTEYLATLSKVKRVVMMLASSDLRVALATTHLPLRDIPSTLSDELLTDVISILHQSLEQQFDIKEPTIMVCGLNPHAGESGHIGNEEQEIITPCINKLKQKGIKLIGPLPADTAFATKHRRQADAILAMYHDQGLAPLKALSFGDAVNITLGLPFIRTSVDHGTALSLAGTGKASSTSLQAAISLA